MQVSLFDEAKENEVLIITLKEITDMIGVRHNDAMTKVERLQNQADFGVLRKTRITNESGGRPTDTYMLNKRQAIAAAAKLNDAMLMKVIVRCEQLEDEKKNQFKIPQTYAEALMIAAQQAQEIEDQRKQLQIQAPKVVYATSIESSVGSVTINDFAKSLSHTFDIGEKRLFKWLRDNRYLRINNQPYQNYLDAGYFQVVPKTRTDNVSLENIPYYQTRITGKGQIYFTNKLKEHFEMEAR